MNIIEFIKNTVSRTLSKYDERFSTVAESGSYDDLSNKPTIPEAYDDTALAARVTANETGIADRYTKAEADALLDGKASLQIAAIPGGGGGEEINAAVSQGENSVSVNYYKDGELPNTLNLNVDSDQFSIPTTAYVDEKAAEAQFNSQQFAILRLTQKQDTLVSGTSIKTINGESILGSGDVSVSQMPSYIVDKPEGNNAQLGNVVQVGTLQDISGEVGIFQFFYRTSALPDNTSKEYTLLPLLQDYNIVDFLDGTGVTSNGIFIGNGRTDGTNYLIIQQFSKNRKAVILRTYQDYSTQTALLKIKFLGTKTTV